MTMPDAMRVACQNLARAGIGFTVLPPPATPPPATPTLLVSEPPGGRTHPQLAFERRERIPA